MRKFVLLTTCFSLLLTVLTLDIVFAATVSEVFKNFKKQYEKFKNFSADFEQTTLISGRKRIARGNVIFQKPNLLKEVYFDPSNSEHITQVIVSDGKILWSYTPLINQVTKTKLAQDGNREELLPGFGPSLENVEKNYSLSLVKDELAEKSDVSVVEIIPKDQSDSSDRFFDVLQVWIQNKDSTPVQFMYKNKNNDMTFIMSFKNTKINENLDKSTFKFEPPAGVQIITAPEQ